jgi:cytochrome c551/c552
MPVMNSASTCALIAALITMAGCGKEIPAPTSTPSSSVAAAPGEALAKIKGCLVCHGVDKANLGPSFREVAKKYAGDSGAATRLIRKVKEGSNGAGGTPPMPPQAHVTDEEANTIVGWVLSLQ